MCIAKEIIVTNQREESYVWKEWIKRRGRTKEQQTVSDMVRDEAREGLTYGSRRLVRFVDQRIGEVRWGEWLWLVGRTWRWELPDRSHSERNANRIHLKKVCDFFSISETVCCELLRSHTLVLELLLGEEGQANNSEREEGGGREEEAYRCTKIETIFRWRTKQHIKHPSDLLKTP